MVADAISFIMAKENCKIFAYVDDFIGVVPRAVAGTYFQVISDLLTEPGLPVNAEENTTLQVRTCLGITIKIDLATFKIEESKLHSIYEVCSHVRHRKFLSKKSFQSLIGKLISSISINVFTLLAYS